MDKAFVTVFAKANKASLSKSIKLNDGHPVSDGSQCRMSEGTAVVVEAATAGALADLINTSASHNALALGVIRGAEPDRNVSIVARSRARSNPNALTRTLEHMMFEPARRAWVLFDFDQKGMPAEVRTRLETAGSFEAAITKVLEKLPTIARVIRPSTSSGLRNTNTGELYAGSGGLHLYLLVEDGADIPRFLDALFRRFWLEGFGWVTVSKAGSFLIRSIIDASVGSPERLVFEGPPTLGPGLEQDANLRAAIATEGEALNSRTCADLSEAEEARFRFLVETAKAASAKEVETVRAAWIETTARRISEKTKKPMATIRAELQRSYAGFLYPDFVLRFDSLGDVAVGEVLDDPERFINETLADPHEPEDQGRNCAILYRGRHDGLLFVWSHAHGGLTYQLEREAAPRSEPTAADREAIEQLRAGNSDAFVDAAKKDPSLPFLDEAITLLAGLMGTDPRGFEQLRTRLKGAGVRVGALSERIEEAAKRDRGSTSTGGGQPLEFEPIEPWPEPVAGEALLSGISDTISRYMVMSKEQRDVTALWAVHTWAHDFRDTSPILLATSPEPGCAKSRLHDTISRLVCRATTTSGISAASLIAVIDMHHPTLLIDEYDALVNGDKERAEAIRGAVNSCHKRAGAYYIKMVSVGDAWEPRRFSVWSPVALAGIDKPQRTILERSLVVRMTKKRRSETVARLRMKDGDDLRILAQKIARFVTDNEIRLRDIDPSMPPGLSDRECDKWDPLFAIADVAGGEWPQRAREAALSFARTDANDSDFTSHKRQLLGDIRDIFRRLYPDGTTRDGKGQPISRHPAYGVKRGPRLSTKRLLAELHLLEEREWATWGRARKPLNDIGLSRLLDGYGAPSMTMKVDASGLFSVPKQLNLDQDGEISGPDNQNTIGAKGYYLSSFVDAWDRYLSPLSPES
jgi:hypothetical protein